MRRPLNLKVQEPNHVEQVVKNYFFGWLTTIPRFVKWGYAISYFNGAINRKQGTREFYVRLHGRWFIKGFPDSIICYRGRVRFVEIKREKGGKTSEDQAEFQAKARKKGYLSDVVNSVDPFKKEILKWMDTIDSELKGADDASVEMDEL